MASGLAALLDDVAALAKLAAASIDDVGAAAGRASVKAAGVVVDDTAVTPAYVRGLAAERELPIIKKIAIGSLRNKIVFILPAALVLSVIAPVVVEIILMLGGTYLCFEGAEKIHHRFSHRAADAEEVPAVMQGPDVEAKTVSGAIRTDFILSAEIMVIALKEVLDESVVQRAIILVVVALVITAIVYGVVALIVKMDDIGLRLAQRESSSSQRIGRLLVAGMPKLLERAVDHRHRGDAVGRRSHHPRRRSRTRLARPVRPRPRRRALGRGRAGNRWSAGVARQHGDLGRRRPRCRRDRGGRRVACASPQG